MTIDEAIETLQAIIETGDYLGEPGDRPALELGIEALKAWQNMRDGYWKPYNYKLPGETEE